MNDSPQARSGHGLPDRASVLGLGRTGVAVARFLAECGVDVVASDSRSEALTKVAEDLSSRGVRVVLGQNEVREGDTVVISPGIPPHSELFQRATALGSEVISEPELFSRVFARPIVAVTGTDGKSTVTTWIAHVLNAAGVRALAGGNLGNPLLGEEGLDDVEVAVLEISAFQLVTTHTLKPAVAVLTNLAEDHLDYFQGDAAAYEAAKRKLVDLCGPGSRVVLSGEDAVISAWEIPQGACRFESSRDGSERSSAWCGDGALWLGVDEEGNRLAAPERLLATAELPLVGAHNERNALQVALATRFFGVSIEGIRSGLRSYSPLPHRCVVVGEVSGVRFIDDSKATNPHAAIAALRGLNTSLILIAGGSEKNSDFAQFGEVIKRTTKAVVATGETAERILGSVPSGHPAQKAKSLEEALLRAFEMADPGDTVLLSPGCASFDAFRSYAHRGEVFTDLVHRLKAEVDP